MARKKDDSEHSSVGYGRPPAEHRFQAGRSGNPKGRPKGSRNFSTDVKQMLKMPVPYEHDGTRTRISTQKATLLRLREKALKGDARALDRMMELARQHNEVGPSAAAIENLAAEDQAILEAYNARIRGEVPAGSQEEESNPGNTEGEEDEQD